MGAISGGYLAVHRHQSARWIDRRGVGHGGGHAVGGHRGHCARRFHGHSHTILTTTVAYFITLPISAGVSTLLYIDQRVRREDLAPVLAQAAQNPSAWDV
jgi:hypothetical protein